MSQSPIYPDNHATTRVEPRVAEAMLRYFSESYGEVYPVPRRNNARDGF